MSRTACVWIPQFELSARLAAAPELRDEPVLVADVGSLRAVVLDASMAAQRCGVQRLMPMVTARALCPEAAIIAPDAAFVRQQRKRVLSELYHLSPIVGHDGLETFFLQLDGLQRIHPNERHLARRIRTLIDGLQLAAAVAIADRPDTAWIAAHSLSATEQLIIATGEDSDFVAKLPAEMIPMPQQLARLCRVLGIDSAADLQRLPAGALCRRFGRVGDELQQRLAGRAEEVYRVEIPETVEEADLFLDDPTDDVEVLLFLHKSVLDRLLVQVVATRRSVAALELMLVSADSDRSRVKHLIRPARPTVKAQVLLDLILLWLRGLELAGPVETIRIRAVEVSVATARQLSLFARQQASSSEALAVAVARLVAAFGKDAVVHPMLANRHLPEARLRWQPVDPTATSSEPQSTLPSDRMKLVPVLQLCQPQPVSLSRTHLWIAGAGGRRIITRQGPYRIAGEWWRQSFDRLYLLLLVEGAEVCWIFREQQSGKSSKKPQWYLQGYLD